MNVNGWKIGDVVSFIYHNRLRTVRIETMGTGKRSGLAYIVGENLYFATEREKSTYTVEKMTPVPVDTMDESTLGNREFDEYQRQAMLASEARYGENG